MGGALSAAAPTHHSPDLRQDLVAQQPEHLSPRVLRHHCWPGRPPPAHTPPLRGCLGAPLGFPLPWEMTQLVPVHSVLSTRIFRADTMCQAALSAQGGMSRHEAPSPAFSVLALGTQGYPDLALSPEARLQSATLKSVPKQCGGFLDCGAGWVQASLCATSILVKGRGWGQ